MGDKTLLYVRTQSNIMGIMGVLWELWKVLQANIILSLSHCISTLNSSLGSHVAWKSDCQTVVT